MSDNLYVPSTATGLPVDNQLEIDCNQGIQTCKEQIETCCASKIGTPLLPVAIHTDFMEIACEYMEANTPWLFG
ncbi:hypothetical protein Tdes44962_MAKER03145 [Teratosphaeria destructans]|uniref:Uncharacterized protein n=1 Tax=Teratosphaeria destructans TaxID=418781 RepID=A0A9W7SRK9_9PEZI|nr:hypothetical protein Tdes44962_MAKER03145 [Teratosphaeria destructans]